MEHSKHKIECISETTLDWSGPVQRLQSILPATIPNNQDKIKAPLVA